MKCPLCDSQQARRYFKVRNSPSLQNVLYESEASAQQASRCEADFWVCTHCLLLFNPAFQDQPYSATYNNDQSFSPAYQAHLATAREMLKPHLHPTDRIVEIGCGTGRFLQELHADGFRTVEGFDPAHGNAVPFVRSETWKPSGVQHDALIFRHVLESLVNFREVLATAIAELSSHGIVYFELTNSRFIVEKGTSVTLYHEYPQYFSETAIGILLDQFGLYIHETRHFMSGQLLGVIARRKSISLPKAPRLDVLSDYRKVCIWGVSGRTIHFLTSNGINKGLVAYGVDIDPKKQGRFVPVTGQRILSPQECVEDRPDAVIVLNELYVGEVASLFPYPVTVLTNVDFYHE